MNISEMIKAVDTIEETYQKSYKDLVSKNKELIKQVSFDILTKFEVNAITWCQYTPYFCDGNACEFTMGDIVLYKEIPEDELDVYDTLEDYIIAEEYGQQGRGDINPNTNVDLSVLIDKFNMLLALEKLQEFTFGNDKGIIITLNEDKTDVNIKVKTYDDHE